VEGQVPQPGVLERADAVLDAGALPVPDFEVRMGQPWWPVGSTGVLVAKQVIRQPLWSVNLSWAPGWGRSRRAMTRMSSGQCWGPNRAGERVGMVGAGIQSVRSATCAPSRGMPAPSTASTQADSGMVSIAVSTGPWAPNPTEYSRPRSVMWCRNAFEPPPASVRTSTWARSVSGN
jgi:hypothetical protein